MAEKTLSTKDHDHVLERIAEENAAGRGDQDCFEPYSDMKAHSQRMAVLEKTSKDAFKGAEYADEVYRRRRREGGIYVRSGSF